MMPFYKTKKGVAYLGRAEDVIRDGLLRKHRHKIDLIFTSPPFPLNTKKRYGNLTGDEYFKWLLGFASLFREVLKPTGSIVMELGNAWEKGKPVMSTLPTRSLLGFLEAGEFELCQQFIWFNPARLPTPAQWVNVERIRVKDAYTQLWWMSPSERPFANNRQVLTSYSDSMKALLKRGSYNSGKRPSEHNIGESSFLTDNSGAIPPNVIVASNTASRNPYMDYCRLHDIGFHPARMPIDVPEFFIKLLTRKRATVLDPFAGSNTTGAAAERLGRKWIAIDADENYLQGSRGWFPEARAEDPVNE